MLFMWKWSCSTENKSRVTFNKQLKLESDKTKNNRLIDYGHPSLKRFNSITVTQAILAFTDNSEFFYNLIAWLR